MKTLRLPRKRRNLTAEPPADAASPAAATAPGACPARRLSSLERSGATASSHPVRSGCLEVGLRGRSVTPAGDGQSVPWPPTRRAVLRGPRPQTPFEPRLRALTRPALLRPLLSPPVPALQLPPLPAALGRARGHAPDLDGGLGPGPQEGLLPGWASQPPPACPPALPLASVLRS